MRCCVRWDETTRAGSDIFAASGLKDGCGVITIVVAWAGRPIRSATWTTAFFTLRADSESPLVLLCAERMFTWSTHSLRSEESPSDLEEKGCGTLIVRPKAAPGEAVMVDLRVG